VDNFKKGVDKNKKSFQKTKMKSKVFLLPTHLLKPKHPSPSYQGSLNPKKHLKKSFEILLSAQTNPNQQKSFINLQS